MENKNKMKNKVKINEDTDMEIIDKELVKRYKLKKPCQDCEKEKGKYLFTENYNFCFEHRWDNPFKLKREKRNLEKGLKKTLIGGVVIIWLLFAFAYVFFSTLGVLSRDTSIWMIPIVCFFLWTPLVVGFGYFFYEFTSAIKENQKDLKKIKRQLSQWIKKY